MLCVLISAEAGSHLNARCQETAIHAEKGKIAKIAISRGAPPNSAIVMASTVSGTPTTVPDTVLDEPRDVVVPSERAPKVKQA
jgi:hypothetical protein